jgi:hypothetical protein
VGVRLDPAGHIAQHGAGGFDLRALKVIGQQLDLPQIIFG